MEKGGAQFTVEFPAMYLSEVKPQYGFIPTADNWLGLREETDDPPLWLKHLEKIYFFEYLPDTKTLYVRQSQIQDDPSEKIPGFYKRVFDFVDSNEVEHFILDLRLNGYQLLKGYHNQVLPNADGMVEPKVAMDGALLHSEVIGGTAAAVGAAPKAAFSAVRSSSRP